MLIGIAVLLIGTIPRNVFFAANLQYYATVPWAVPLIGIYLWLFWRYMKGDGPPESTTAERRTSLRAELARAATPARESSAV